MASIRSRRRLLRRAAPAAALAAWCLAGPGPAPAGAQPAPPVVSVGSVTVMETLARSDWVQALLPVTLSRPAPADVTVSYATADGTARAALPDRDYQPASGTLTIPAGARDGLIQVFVLGDSANRIERDETLTVALTDPTGATLGTATGSIVIRDRTTPGLVVSDLRVVEPDDSDAARAVATIALSERAATDVSVAWSTQELPPWPPAAAYEGPDFLARSGTAVIPAGSLDTRVQLRVRGDLSPEGPEQFRLVLDPATTTAPVADPSGTVTILDNDPPAPFAVTRASVSSDGTPADFLSTGRPDLSADGRYVAFTSEGRNLVREGTGVFLRDLVTNVTSPVAVDVEGGPANDRSEGPAISADGRVVAFFSVATDLEIGRPIPEFNVYQLYVRDLTTGTTTMVSAALDGNPGNQATLNFDEPPSLSADGRFVAFSSHASNLVPGDTNGIEDVFVRDVLTGTTSRVSVASDGSQAQSCCPNFTGSSTRPAISADGRFVGYASDAPNLVPGDTNDRMDVFVRDTVTGTTSRVSVASDGTQGLPPGPIRDGGIDLTMSSDGRLVGFTSSLVGLVPDDDNGAEDLFLHDRATGATTRPFAVQGDGSLPHTGKPSLSADGRLVAFSTDAFRLGFRPISEIFVLDVSTGTLRKVSTAADGTRANSRANAPRISGDGHSVAFYSDSTNLLPEDTGTSDVYVVGPLGP